MKPLSFPETTDSYAVSIVGIFWHYVSECGQYRVSMFRSDVDASPAGIRWHAAHMRDASCGWWDQIARVRTRESAERHCRRHRNETRKQQAAARKRGER